MLVCEFHPGQRAVLIVPYLCSQPSSDSSVTALTILFPHLYHLLVQTSQEQPVLVIFALVASSRGLGRLHARNNFVRELYDLDHETA